MKKYFLLIPILTILVCVQVAAQTAQNDSVFTDSYSSKSTTKTISKYNSHDVLSERSTYSYDFAANKWKGSSKLIYQLDANNQVLGVITYTWDSDLEKWVPNTKNDYSYDNTNNQMLGYNTYSWNAEFETWQLYGKGEYIWSDVAGQFQQIISYSWDSETSTWTKSSETEYTYDEAGVISMQTTNAYLSGSLYYVYTITYDNQYDSKGNILFSITTSTMTGVSNSESKSKSEYAYNSENKRVLAITYTWNAATQAWQESSKVNYTLDSNGNSTQQCTYIWRTDTQAWQENSKVNYTLDGNGNAIQQYTYNWNTAVNDWQLSNRTTNFVRGSSQKMVNICPSSLGLKKNGNLNISVAEKPTASSRVWKYKRATETSYQVFSPSKTSPNITVSFDEVGTYNVICESQIDGQTYISNETSISIADVSIAPAGTQNLKTNQQGASLLVSELPIAASRRWYYARKSGGPYTSISNTNISYTPIFAEPGTYYVICQSTIGNETIISNEVEVNVLGISIAPMATQVINPNQIGKIVRAIEMPRALSKEWKFKTAKEGVWKSFYPTVTGDSCIPKFPTIGEYYIACFSTVGTETQISNEVTIKVVEKPTINPVKEQTIKTFTYGDTLKVYESSPASSRYWFYSTTKGTYNNYVQPYSYTTSYRPYFTQPGTYYVVCKSTWDGVQLTSNEVKINVVGNGVTPEAGQSIIKGQKGNTLQVKESNKPSQREWKYKSAPTGTWQSFNPMQDTTFLIPSFNAVGTYYIACFSKTGSVTDTSNEVAIKVVEQTSITPTANQQVDINTNAATLTVTETPTASSRYWYYSKTSGGSYTNSYVSTTTYQPKFEESGTYYVVCKSTYDNLVVTSNEVAIKVSGYPTVNFTVNVTPIAAQAINRNQYGATLTVAESATPSSRRWYYSTTSGSGYTNDTYSTGSTYRPYFSKLGTFYVVCLSKFDTLAVTSNEVEVNVVGNLISSTSTQNVPIRVSGKTLSVEEYPAATSREWKYKTSSNGAWDSFSTPENGVVYTPTFANSGEYYVACFSTINGATYTTSEARIRASASSIAPSSTQNISVNTNGATLTVAETYSSSTKEWYCSTNANKEYHHYLGSGNSYVPNFSEPGIYYVVCKSTWSEGAKYSNEVVVSVVGNNVAPIFPQALPPNTSGSQLTVYESTVATTRAWKYKTSADGSWLSFSPLQTGVSYTPKFTNTGTYYVACHSTIASNTYISNEVVVKTVTSSITPSTEQVIPQNINGNLLSVASTMPADRHEWYYSTTSGGEYAYYLGNGASCSPIFSKSGAYFIVCKSYFGNVSMLSNEVKISVAGNDVSSSTSQTIVAKTNGATISVNEFPVASSREWKYKTSIESTWLSFSPKQTGVTLTPNFTNAGTYQIACFSTIAGNTYTSNEVAVRVVTNSISPVTQQMLHLNQEGNTLTVTENTPAEKRNWYYSVVSGKNYSNLLGDGATYRPHFTNAGTYFVVCKSTWGNTTAVSNEVKIVALSNDTLLQSLSVNSGTLMPSFSSNVSNYSVNVENSVTSITLSATKNNSNQTITGAGVQSLSVGSNIFNIVVTAESGIHSKTYSIAVHRADLAKQNQTITWSQTLNAAVGNSPIALNATASSGLTVSYSSNNTNVATVSGSTLTIIGSGTAIITAQQGGSLTYNAAPEVQKTLTVSNPAKQNQTITWNQVLSVAIGSSSLTLNAAANSGLSVSYTSSNTNVARVSGSTLTIIGVGTSIISANQAGNTTYNAAPEVQKTLTVTSAATAVEVELNNKLKVYPNPTSGMVYVDKEQAQECVIYNLNGNILLRTKENMINMERYPSGAYILQIGDTSIKMIKQ